MRRLVVALFLLTQWVSLLPVPADAQSAADEVAAAQTAIDLSYLESIGDFNGLYDRIHPDAHAIIPRAAVIGWYQNEFYPQGPGVATVTGVRFIQWTWPVNGVTYPVTAEVSFQQPFADGSVAEDVVRLVKDGTGQWRWFFGRSREFVEEQIARYAPQVTGAPTNIVDFVIADLNTFWSVSFSAAGRGYVAPGVSQLVPGTAMGCGYLSSDEGPGMYCSRDMTVYVDVSWIAILEQELGDFAWITVLAHEFGHHVQYLERVPYGSNKAIELQADCLAGAYARDAETRGLLDPGDVTEAVAISAMAGDPPWLPSDSNGAHGTGDERVSAFMRGFLDGFTGCGFLSASSPSRAVNPPVPGGADISDLLPSPDDVPPDVTFIADTRRTLSEVAVNYTDPSETERLFESWGWQENATRTYEGTGAQGGITSVYASVHRFVNAEGAANGLRHSINDQAASTGGWEVAVSPIGDTTRALATAGEVTVYVQQGNVMLRLTVGGSSGSLMLTAESIVASILSRAS